MNQIELSFEARDKGIHQAITHADGVCDRWSDKVYALFYVYLMDHPEPFQMEDFREWGSEVIEEPPSKRAFGHIVLRAAREGLITRVGYAPVKNVTAHRAFASVWKSIK
jgi:hypothetical protein